MSPERAAPPAGAVGASSGSAGPSGPATLNPELAEVVETRRGRLWEWADARHIPLQTILAFVVVVAGTYLAGRLIYKLREVLLIMVVAGFIALLLNPAVTFFQRWVVRRRGAAVAIVTVLAL